MGREGCGSRVEVKGGRNENIGGVRTAERERKIVGRNRTRGK